MQAAENEKLTEILSAGLPMKILVQTDDILEQSPVGDGHLAFGLRSRQLASVAMGLNDVFVLQSSSANLVRFRDRIGRGIDYPGPALFSVFSGSPEKAGGLSPYLSAAAAMESRAFPAFTYNANQQSYIADINAGTYAQLVEAAESCQVAIIHPGKPRNPNEPGLEELLKRAEAFA